MPQELFLIVNILSAHVPLRQRMPTFLIVVPKMAKDRPSNLRATFWKILTQTEVIFQRHPRAV